MLNPVQGNLPLTMHFTRGERGGPLPAKLAHLASDPRALGLGLKTRPFWLRLFAVPHFLPLAISQQTCYLVILSVLLQRPSRAS